MSTRRFLKSGWLLLYRYGRCIVGYLIANNVQVVMMAIVYATIYDSMHLSLIIYINIRQLFRSIIIFRTSAR